MKPYAGRGSTLGTALLLLLVLQPLPTSASDLASTTQLVPESDELLSTFQGTSINKTLSFPVCNGFANQRIALVFGVFIAAQTDRTAVLPDIILDGTQYTDASNYGDMRAAFEDFYDLPTFTRGMADLGSRVVPASYFSQKKKNVVLEAVPCETMSGVCVDFLKENHADTSHIKVGCLFPASPITPDAVFQNRNFFLGALNHLQPAAAYRATLALMMERLHFLSSLNKYNFLHLRVEHDWMSHCARWESIRDGIVRNNCLNNTFTIGQHLQSRGFEKEVPLYIATSWPSVREDHAKSIRASLHDAGYKCISKIALIPEMVLTREEGALLEYMMGLNADKMIGNSVSSYSAMMILEREANERWSSYYNLGNIPLADFLPLFTLPWVFVWNSWSAEYEYMMLSAVRSAIDVGGLRPYCMFSGELQGGTKAWMAAHNVTLVKHNPDWMMDMAEKNDRSQANMKHSHLYAKPEYVIGTWARIDIPVVPAFMEHNFILYTDTDVFFRQRISLADFPQPLPEYVGMGGEMQDYFPFNAGILLINMAGMRSTRQGFLDFVFANENGLYFDRYGPQDQGALNQFYETSVQRYQLPKIFNTKPYHAFTQESRLIHWHGPKPHDYLGYLETGQCRFGDLCRDGLTTAVCTYVEDWAGSALDSVIARRLSAACKVLAVLQQHVK